MDNNEIKSLISLSGINQYEVANKIGISEFYFCRIFRQEIDENLKQKIVLAIKEILTQKKDKINGVLETVENSIIELNGGKQ